MAASLRNVLKWDDRSTINTTTPTRHRPSRAIFSLPQRATGLRRQQEVALFTRNMAMLLDVGLPPLQTLVLLQRGANSPSLNTAIEKIVDAVNNGRPMSHGMRHSPQVFDEVYVHLVSTGELNGQLPKTLSQLAVDLERKIKLKRDVRSALIYPSCVVTTAALTSSLLLVFVIPTFKDLFADFGVALPWLTQKVIALSELSVRWLPGTLGTLCVLFAVLARLMSTTRGRDSFDSVSLTCPLVGKLLVQSSLARVARTLSTTLEAGVPILPALQASGHAADNSSIRRDIEEARLKVAEGVPLSQALTRSKLISPTMIQMLEVGERTGSLDKMLGKIAHYYEDEVERAVTNLKHLIEPVIMVVLGTVVGGIVLAMYLPIFNMGALVR